MIQDTRAGGWIEGVAQSFVREPGRFVGGRDITKGEHVETELSNLIERRHNRRVATEGERRELDTTAQTGTGGRLRTTTSRLGRRLRCHPGSGLPSGKRVANPFESKRRSGRNIGTYSSAGNKVMTGGGRQKLFENQRRRRPWK